MNTIEGVLVKQLTKHNDERGFFEELIRISDAFFKEGFGQLSHSLMYPGVIKAWHIHRSQVDWWFVARGTLKVALFDLREDSKTFRKLMEIVLGKNGDNVILKIPPGVAHGCKVFGEKTSELFYVTSGVYNAEEEGRIPHDDPKIAYDWIKVAPIK